MKSITKDNLLKEFYEEYKKKNGKFLLFDLANANENANTKVLKHLLQYNSHQFLASFLERVGLPKHNGQVCIKDQEKAIGNKETGFIDLYLEYDNIYVIVENKIYGAGDTDKQLARYIATVNGVKKDNFDNWYNNPSIGNQDIHVVYLTADGTKEPSENSLPSNLKERITYYAINYKDDILPWLEEDVLPQLPYGTDGMMIAGVLQYIAFLKQLLADESSAVVDKFIEGLQLVADKEKYEQLLSAIEKNDENVPENVQKSLRKQLGARAEAIFSADVQGEWVLHFTPSFIILYKKSWAALDTRKYSIPSLYIYAGNTDAFLKNQYFNKFCLAVDHLSPAAKGKYQQRSFGNHDKNTAFPLLDDPSAIKCADINDKNARKGFYTKVINQITPKVAAIDEVVAQLQNSGTAITPDAILDEVIKKNI